MRSCSWLVLVNQSIKQVAAAHPGSAGVADSGQGGVGIGRFQSKGSVWTMLGVVPEVDPWDLLEVTAANDQQPGKALGPDGRQPTLGVGVGVGRLHRCDQNFVAFCAEHLVEAAAERRVAIADKEAHPACLVLQAQQQVVWACWVTRVVLGLAVTPARWTRRVPRSMKHKTERRRGQTVSTVKQVAGEDPGRLLAQQRPPGGDRWPRRWIQPVAAQGGGDRGRRDAHPEPEQLTRDALVAPAWVLAGQADDQPLQLLSRGGRPVPRCG